MKHVISLTLLILTSITITGMIYILASDKEYRYSISSKTNAE